MLLCFGTATSSFAQAPGVHYRHHGDMSPGAIGRWQLQRGGPLPGYYQPVEITAPPGATISLATDQGYGPSEPAPVRVGLLIAPVYRLKVSNIPLAAGAEVYPTIEVINRTYPPPAETAEFPILIELTQEDLELALEGKYVTRVIYLENPHQALPVTYERGRQAWFDVGPGVDPLYMADLLGRPVAILRMGGRIPIDGNLRSVPGDCAPFIRIREKPAPTVAPRELPVRAAGREEPEPAQPQKQEPRVTVPLRQPKEMR